MTERGKNKLNSSLLHCTVVDSMEKINNGNTAETWYPTL